MSISVAAVISNHCVLQRNKNISIFGWCESKDSGKKITASLFNSENQLLSKNSTFARGEQWIVQLEPQSAQKNCTLKVETEDSTFNFSDIAIGEVWLAGGQSNMEFELQNCTEGPEELKITEDPNVRFYYTNKIAWMDESFYQAEKSTCWQTWDSEWKKAWSAVGYFYAKKLAQDTGVTVGLIGCNWGGTSASAWMNKEHLEKDLELKTYLDEQEEATKGKSIEQQCREYDEYTKRNDEWQKKCNEIYAKEPDIEWAEVQNRIGTCEWPGPKSCKNPFRPCGLYQTMLKRVMPYTIKGVIWYQGESDDHKPNYYYKLFSTMIDNWREDWNESDLPFIFVQLVNHRYRQDKDFKHWCLVREAQQKVHNTIKNAFMTCAFDLGWYNDIHPKSKKELGTRMENIAMQEIYPENNKSKIPAFSPMLKSSLVKDDCIITEFSDADDGFIVRNDAVTDQWFKDYEKLEVIQGNKVPEGFTGFEVAGSDGIYYPAEFSFGKEKPNQIILKSAKVPHPAFARYAWFNYGPVTIYSKNKLPLAPFRTSVKDSAPAATEHTEIQQIMTVNSK